MNHGPEYPRKKEKLTRRDLLKALASAGAAIITEPANAQQVSSWEPNVTEEALTEHSSLEARERWITNAVGAYKRLLESVPHTDTRVIREQPYISRAMVRGTKYDATPLLNRYCYMAYWVPMANGRRELNLIPPGPRLERARKEAATKYPYSNCFFISPTIMLVAGHAFLAYAPQGTVGYEMQDTDHAVVEIPNASRVPFENIVPVDFSQKNTDIIGDLTAIVGHDPDATAAEDGTKIYYGTLGPSTGIAMIGSKDSANHFTRYTRKSLVMRLPDGEATGRLDGAGKRQQIPAAGMSGSPAFRLLRNGTWVLNGALWGVMPVHVGDKKRNDVLDVTFVHSSAEIHEMFSHPSHDYTPRFASRLN